MTGWSRSRPRKAVRLRSVRKIVGVAMVAVVSMALTSCGGSDDKSGGDSSSTPVKFGFLASAAIVPFTAEQEGFFKKYGVDATSENIPGGPNVLAAALGGSVDVFSGSPPLTSAAVEQGRCIKFLSFEQGNVVNIIGSPKGSWPNAGKGLESLQDLKGKKLGVTAVGGGVHTWVLHALKVAGVDPSSITFVAVGAGPAPVAALTQGSVDAIASVPPQEQLLGEDGFTMIYKMVGEPDSPLKDLMVTGVAAQCDWIEEHPEAALGICKGMWDANEFAFDPKNRETMIANVKKLSGSDDQAVAEGSWNISFESGQTQTAEITKELWEAQQQFMAEGAKLTPYDDAVYKPCNSGDPRK